MGMLENIQSGRENRPPRIVIYGNEGLGKSTFASQSANPVFIQTEDGLGQIDCKKFPLATSGKDVINQVIALRDEDHDFQTVVIDSLSGLEKLLEAEILKKYGGQNMATVAGGYGAGYKELAGNVVKLLNLLDELRNKRNMAIILIAHTGILTVNPADGESYDREAPRLNRNSLYAVSEWADIICYARIKAMTRKSDDRNIVVGQSERELLTSVSAGYFGKNRYNLPPVMPLSWDAFIDAYRKVEESHNG